MLQIIPPIQHHIHTDPTTPPPTPTPGWQHRLWDTTTLPTLVDTDTLLANLYTHYLHHGDHTAIRHLLRPLVLTKIGGIYTEPGTHLAEGLRTSPYMDEDAWLVRHPTRPHHLTGTLIAARPGHPYLTSLRRAIGRIAQHHTPTATELGDTLLTNVFDRKKRNDIPLADLATVTAPTPTPPPTPRNEPEPTPTPPPTTTNEPQPPLPRWDTQTLTPKGTAATRVPPESHWW